MKNHEKYKDEIMKILIETGCGFTLVGNELKQCDTILCKECEFNKKKDVCCRTRKEWLNEEYQEARIQEECKHLKVDDKVLVSSDGEFWERRYFSSYENGKIYAFVNGRTSWTSTDCITCWEYAKLPENENDLEKGDA